MQKTNKLNRLVYAEDALATIYRERVYMGDVGYIHAKAAVNDAPTVDAVEVVRCKNCHHYQNGYCNHFGYYDYAPKVEAEDFCSHGWRKENRQ